MLFFLANVFLERSVRAPQSIIKLQSVIPDLRSTKKRECQVMENNEIFFIKTSTLYWSGGTEGWCSWAARSGRSRRSRGRSRSRAWTQEIGTSQFATRLTRIWWKCIMGRCQIKKLEIKKLKRLGLSVSNVS